MGKVRLLSDRVANQIAAGEVIERPASVIKELVENSIDAGASRIEVEFRGAGARFMRIEDNGSGMAREDALLAIERHATSKLRSVGDLDGLGTMGFRGEAVPSIASVSKFLLQTREASSDSGTEILIDGGSLVHARDCGVPQGTRITVSNLFNTVPARRKFLKSETTESAHIVHCVRLYALAHPEIGFSLLDNGRSLFHSPAQVSLESRIAEIYGRQIAKSLIEVDAQEDGMRLRGYIGKSSLSRSSRHEMLFFVNDRPVENKTLSYALMESYYGHVPKGRYPVSFLFLDLGAERVDVNVHPAKREIRFRDESKARGFAVRTVLDALKPQRDSLKGLAPVTLKKPVRARALVDSARELPEASASAKGDADLQGKPDSSVARSASAGAVPLARSVAASRPSAQAPQQPAAVKPSMPGAENALPARGGLDRSGWRCLGLAHREYALFEPRKGIVLLSLRAAQRRILYERMRSEWMGGGAVHCQKLLFSQAVELDPLSAASLEEHLGFFRKLGFEMAPFGRNFFRLEGIPTWMPEGEGEAFVRDTVALIRQGSVNADDEQKAMDFLTRHAASRLRLPQRERSEKELWEILDQLFGCERPLTDPDGRPTLLEFGQAELDRRFQRRGNEAREEIF